MIITRNWLANFLDLTGVTDDQITVALNSLGFEVDAYKSYNQLNDDLTIAHVGNVSPIEGTHLNFCFVDKGEDLVSPVVCGASNVKEGQFIILAEPGKTIANGLTLSNREIKGKMSEGMICALTELGLEESALCEQEKDWIYPVHTKTDTYSLIGHNDALDAIGFKDSTWEVDLTLNRSDALGAMQLVKELANYFNKDINDLSTSYEQIVSKSNVPVSIKLDQDSQKLVRSCAMQLFDIKEVLAIEKIEHKIYSNQDIWLKFSQSKSTLNFWKDLANAIAIETGQPVIFLDADKLKSQLEIKNNPTDKNKVNWQLMSNGEVISTLGIDISDQFLPTDDSKQVVAVYLSLDPILMRQQQKSFNSSSVFLQRWMKPISSRLYNLASLRTMYWFDQYNIYGASSTLEIQVESQEQDIVVEVKKDFIDNLLGLKLNFNQIKELFTNLDFELTLKDEVISFKIDKYRTDISHAAHIVEEIARLYGYNNIPAVAPVIKSTPNEKQLNFNLKNQIQSYLIGMGYNNIKTYSLMNSSEVEKWDLFNIKKPINLMSPLSQLRETYRLSIARSAIEAASLNYARGNKNVKLYEFADVYNLDNVRELHLSVLASGEVLNQKAYDLDIKANYAYIKGILDNILNHYQISYLDIELNNITTKNEDIHPYINAEIKYKNQIIGFIFKLNPRFEQANKIDATFVIELSLTRIANIFNDKVMSEELSKFQKTSRDVTMLLKQDQKYSDIINQIKIDVDYIVNVKLVDIYQDEQLKAKNSSAVSVGFEFNSFEKQLTDSEVSEQWTKLLNNIGKSKIEVK
ncbi:phenylalanine--tRNA ligase subunit beta [Spiroplasma culicicola]|uniref:Phenylalanine--tRNA ligase beta subunit n=1 Tax=Spiroplasma culicicola AES-1 TaxID=1276246 RepID=W6A7L8_9MOLU|nr:phenylalanine--tRNA ligase subunit beta [Spiroplasma culicicola]AHI53133.1 phenylalanyl-tRNA synthetase subunit beta [Spiroplasma culicicola AES-1]